MQITVRELWTMIHGIGFGALYLWLVAARWWKLFRFNSPPGRPGSRSNSERFLQVYLVAMVVLAWFAVLTGAYVVYPWYRAVPPPGTADLASFRNACSVEPLYGPHGDSIGMEWKEHVAWFVPILITMAAAVFREISRRSSGSIAELRTAVLGFALASFLAAGIAGFFGAMINKYAPVQGGHVIQLSQEQGK